MNHGFTKLGCSNQAYNFSCGGKGPSEGGSGPSPGGGISGLGLKQKQDKTFTTFLDFRDSLELRQ